MTNWTPLPPYWKKYIQQRYNEIKCIRFFAFYLLQDDTNRIWNLIFLKKYQYLRSRRKNLHGPRRSIQVPFLSPQNYLFVYIWYQRNRCVIYYWKITKSNFFANCTREKSMRSKRLFSANQRAVLNSLIQCSKNYLPHVFGVKIILRQYIIEKYWNSIYLLTVKCEK